ncbi:hypothetical protein GGS21DRAFT_443650 [Xylaria nigripes]|nr:hypothetical protein GGS21DRAFT_443650 [Xylaria nigripes]
MQLPRSVLPSQKYSPVSEYAYESHHEAVASARQPLSESNGNVQPHGLAVSTALCYNQLSLSPPIHSIPAPSILPTQTLTSIYGTSLRGERSLHRHVSLQELPMGNQRGRRNPIYHHKNFADYRNKVMQKELDKEKPVWPDWLEDAFLDALLLIPQLGRKKFSSKTILYGRNMLITEYLWIYHWTLHLPKKGERIPTGKQREKTKQNPGHPMFRSRKQVSSHIQVLKGFFPTLPTFHFIFPRQKDGLDDDRKLVKEEDDTESFKNNRVLISITDGRLPDERPNYEYFSRLLNAENDVFIRPKTCWIFVSSPKITLKERLIALDDGAMKKQITGNHPDGLCLTEADYPHLSLNEGKGCKDLPRQGDRPVVLLHEYTRTLAQKESSSVKDISSKWDVRFPDLRQKLTNALDDSRPSDERTSRCVVGPCDTFHFETVLDLHSTSKFPPGSDMNGLVEFTISRPDLHNHIWRSRTCVIKPEELYMSGEDDIWEQSNPIDVTSSHRPGCSVTGRCDCIARGNRDSISIPFPASSWANTFIKLAPFVTAERERKECERAARESSSLGGRAEREAARMKKEKDDPSPHLKSKLPSPKDLLAQVAMYQEIWSAPQTDVVDGAGDDDLSSKRGRGKWTRRGVILWTFVPVHESIDEKGKTTVVPPGTNWRFLTKIDPTSSYHQQQAYISGSPRVVSRSNVMSPSPGYAHQINAVMNENLSAAYEAGPTAAFTLPSHPRQHHHVPHIHQPSHLAGMNPGLDAFSNGLATPPPTGTLSHSYPHTFDSNNIDIEPTHTLHHHLSFMSDGTNGSGTTDHTQASFLASNDPNSSEAFLSGLDVPDYIPDFSTAPSAASLGDLTHRFIDPSHSVADAGVPTWVDTGVSAASTAESEWAAIAAAAAAVAGHSQHPGEHGIQDTRADLSNGPDHQDSWTAWQAAELGCMPPSYSRRTSGSIWDEGSPDVPEDETAAFSLGGTGLTPLRNHTHPNLLSQNHIPVLTSHPAQSQLQHSPMLTNRKRSRTESIGLDADDDDECEQYPAHSIRKLAHHPSTAGRTAYAVSSEGQTGGAPAAVMGDGSGSFM